MVTAATAAVVRQNVLLETANVQVHIPIIATVVIGKLTNTAQTDVIHLQEDVKVTQAAAAVHQNATMEITNVQAHLPTIVPAVLGSMTNTAQTAVTHLQENVKVTQAVVAEVHQNALQGNTNAKTITHTNAKVVLGSMKNTAQTVATIRQANATAVLAAETLVAVTLRNATMASIVAPPMFRKGAAVENG